MMIAEIQPVWSAGALACVWMQAAAWTLMTSEGQFLVMLHNSKVSRTHRTRNIAVLERTLVRCCFRCESSGTSYLMPVGLALGLTATVLIHSKLGMQSIEQGKVHRSRW